MRNETHLEGHSLFSLLPCPLPLSQTSGTTTPTLVAALRKNLMVLCIVT